MYVRKIVLNDSFIGPLTQGKDMAINIPSDYGKADKAWWAAMLMHETWHCLETYNNKIDSIERAELSASKKQKEVLKTISAPQWMIEYVEKSERDKWWGQSPEKNALLEQMLNQISQQQ